MQAAAWVVDRPEVAEQLGHLVRADLVQLVDLPEDGRGVGDAQAGVETLGQPPVVHPHQHRRQPEVGVQPLQGLQGDQRQLDVVVGGQRRVVDDVDVGLGELAVAALLRALTPPHLLDLVAPERERQLVRVLQHVAGERHRQVEVQTELGPGVVGRVQPLDDVHLLVDLPLLGQPVDRLDGPGLDRGEPVQLERLPQPVQHVLLDDALVGGVLGESGQRTGTAHGARSLRSWSSEYQLGDEGRALVTAIRNGLAEHADPETAAQQQRYMKSTMPFRGLKAPLLRSVVRPLIVEHHLPDRAQWEAAVRTLWDEAAYREERYAAEALAGDRRYRGYQDPDCLDLYEHLVVSGAWWDHVDVIAIHLIGPIQRSSRPALDATMRTWSTDPESLATPGRDHPPDRRQGGDRPSAAGRLHPAQPGRSRVLHPQGDRLGAPPVRPPRARLGSWLSSPSTRTGCPDSPAARPPSTCREARRGIQRGQG